MPRIVFLGNCQASALRAAYNVFIAEDADQQATAIDWRHVSTQEIETLRGAETVVLQVSDQSRGTPEFVPSSVKLVRFPYVSGGFLWPFAHEGHINRASSRMAEFGVYGENGDAFLNRMLREGVSPADAVDRYLNMDIASVGKLDRRFELTLELQSERDEIAEIDVHSFIVSRFRTEQLFLDRGHLGKTLSRFVAVEVFKKLNVPADRCARVAQPNLQEFYEPQEHPIHPKVAAHFGLTYGRAGHRFNANHVLSTFPEYCDAYMRGEFNEVLYQGIRLYYRRDLPGAIEILERGITECGDSPLSLLILAESYSRLGEHAKAMAFAGQGMTIDPADARFAVFFAEQYLKSGQFDQVQCMARRILHYHPGHWYGLHYLEVLDARRKA